MITSKAETTIKHLMDQLKVEKIEQLQFAAWLVDKTLSSWNQLTLGDYERIVQRLSTETNATELVEYWTTSKVFAARCSHCGQIEAAEYAEHNCFFHRCAGTLKAVKEEQLRDEHKGLITQCTNHREVHR